jgi:hypothetical protein
MSRGGDSLNSVAFVSDKAVYVCYFSESMADKRSVKRCCHTRGYVANNEQFRFHSCFYFLFWKGLKKGVSPQSLFFSRS